MPMLRSGAPRAEGSSFAHLLGFGRKASKAEEMPPEEEKAEGEEKPVEGEDAPKEEPTAEAPEDKPQDGAEEKPEEETPAQARAAERARCRAIFASPAAARNVAMAAHLAFDTDLTAAQAIGLLNTVPSSNGLGARMADAPNPQLGAGTPPKAAASSPEAVAAGMLAAARKARGA